MNIAGQYEAFISYNRETDANKALFLKNALKRYGKSKFDLLSRNVFLDKESFGKGVSLESFDKVIRNSEYLILLANPTSARSTWIIKEVEIWLKYHPIEKLIIVLTGGEISAKADNPMVIDWNRTTSLPSNLQKHMTYLPNYVELDWVRDQEKSEMTLQNAQFELVCRDILAQLKGNLPPEQIRNEVQSIVKRDRRVLNTAFYSVLVLLVASITFGWQWRNNAELFRYQKDSTQLALVEVKEQKKLAQNSAEMFRLQKDSTQTALTQVSLQKAKADKNAKERDNEKIKKIAALEDGRTKQDSLYRLEVQLSNSKDSVIQLISQRNSSLLYESILKRLNKEDSLIAMSEKLVLLDSAFALGDKAKQGKELILNQAREILSQEVHFTGYEKLKFKTEGIRNFERFKNDNYGLITLGRDSLFHVNIKSGKLTFIGKSWKNFKTNTNRTKLTWFEDIDSVNYPRGRIKVYDQSGLITKDFNLKFLETRLKANFLSITDGPNVVFYDYDSATVVVWNWKTNLQKRTSIPRGLYKKKPLWMRYGQVVSNNFASTQLLSTVSQYREPSDSLFLYFDLNTKEFIRIARNEKFSSLPKEIVFSNSNRYVIARLSIKNPPTEEREYTSRFYLYDRLQSRSGYFEIPHGIAANFGYYFGNNDKTLVIQPPSLTKIRAASSTRYNLFHLPGLKIESNMDLSGSAVRLNTWDNYFVFTKSYNSFDRNTTPIVLAKEFKRYPGYDYLLYNLVGDTAIFQPEWYNWTSESNFEIITDSGYLLGFKINRGLLASESVMSGKNLLGFLGFYKYRVFRDKTDGAFVICNEDSSIVKRLSSDMPNATWWDFYSERARGNGKELLMRSSTERENYKFSLEELLNSHELDSGFQSANSLAPVKLYQDSSKVEYLINHPQRARISIPNNNDNYIDHERVIYKTGTELHWVDLLRDTSFSINTLNKYSSISFFSEDNSIIEYWPYSIAEKNYHEFNQYQIVKDKIVLNFSVKTNVALGNNSVEKFAYDEQNQRIAVLYQNDNADSYFLEVYDLVRDKRTLKYNFSPHKVTDIPLSFSQVDIASLFWLNNKISLVYRHENIPKHYLDQKVVHWHHLEYHTPESYLQRFYE